jgi:hypothetical protein
MAGIYNFEIEQGATFSRPIAISDDGVARDLTGYTAQMQIRPTKTSQSVILELSTANGRIVISDPASGEMTWILDRPTTAALDFCEAFYDLLLDDGSGTTERLLEGSVTLSLGVTRD